MQESTLICQQCGRVYPDSISLWRCQCGGLFDLNFIPKFDWVKIKQRPHNLWRYREALPIRNDQHIVSFSEGFTELLQLQLANRKIWVKQEHLFQTGSYKDRGASVLISHAHEIGIQHVVEDSSGNAGCAIAAYAARAGIRCDIYVPAETSPAKLAQIRSYGACLHLIPGSREDTATAVLNAAQDNYYASHSWNPYFFQGTKTIAYEIWEQLGGKSPDIVILPVGNGTLLLGAFIGFQDLMNAGLIDTFPKLIGVQAQACSPLVDRLHGHLQTTGLVRNQHTIAEGIAISLPIRGHEILNAVQATRGDLIRVSEHEIITAIRTVHRMGFYIEPTSATVIAAINKLENIDQEQSIVTVFSGHGLKSTEKILSLYPEE